MLTSDLSDEFFADVTGVAADLGCEGMELLSVMMSESGVKATAANPSGASGLIQFMPDTLQRLGWTEGPAAFRQLDADEQLPFVRKYFLPYVAKGLSPAARLYQATFLPATLNLGSDPDTVICAQGGINSFAYASNTVFDADRDGQITVGELQAAIDRNAHGARWQEIVARLNGAPLDTRIDLNTVEGVQQALTELGYDPGAVDGANGPHTRAAVAQFQEDNGLTADGIVGPDTRDALATALGDQGIDHI